MRPIVKIDEEKCNGCGKCIIGCAEGALQLVDGKAKLVKESYCDGLGACIGDCPQGAITIEEREADSFDEEAVEQNLRAQQACGGGACPGSTAQRLRLQKAASPPIGEPASSMLSNWPVQLALMPVNAPYLRGARLLLSADCVPFAAPDFHSRFVAGRVVAVGCPKLDNAQFYQDKLVEIIRHNELAAIDVVYMEVPCCGGLVRIVERALAEAGKDIELTLTKVGLDGRVLEYKVCA